MYKVLLADTDTDNIKNFTNYINSSYPVFKVAAALTTFRHDYINTIRKHGPRLIIADVRFFGVNSSMIITEIHTAFPELRFILYGNLNETDYLNKYLEFGAIDYMIKPVRPSDLGRRLDAAAAYFDMAAAKEKELQKLIKSYKENESAFENLFLTNLINGVILNSSEILDNFQYFKIDMEKDFTVIEIKIDNFQKINKTLGPQEKHLMIYGLLNTVMASLMGKKSKSFVSAFNTITVIVAGETGIENLYKTADMLKNSIFNKNKIRVTIGVGRTYEEAASIHVSYNEAVAAINHRYYLGYNSVIPIDFAQPNNYLSFNYSFVKEQKAAFMAALGEFDKCGAILEEIFQSLRKAEPLPEKLVSQILVEIMITTGRYLQEQNHVKNISVSDFLSTQEALRVKTADEGYRFLYNNLKKFCDHVNAEKLKADMSILEKAKDHLKLRYYEQISLIKTALIVKTTPDYLNKLFLEYEKESYYEYAVGARLEVAKRFLRETDLDDSIIAVNIGYDDGKYFRAVFRQYENMETNDYRQKYGH